MGVPLEPGEAPVGGDGRGSRQMFAALVYLDSLRAVIEPLGYGEPALEVGLGILSSLVNGYGGQVTEVDVRSGTDVQFTLRFPLPQSFPVAAHDDVPER